MIRFKARLSNKVNKRNEAPLIFDITYQKTRFYFTTGLLLQIDMWNHEKQEVKKKAGYNASLLNTELRNKKFQIEAAVEKLIKLQIPVNKENVLIHSELESAITSSKTLYSYYEEFLEERQSKFAPSTIQKYVYLKKALKDFSEKYNAQISFKNMNEKFIIQFEKYFLVDRKVYNNGLGSYIKNLKVFLKWSSEKGYNTFNEYKKFAIYREEADIFPLTEEEITIFENASFTGLKEDIRNVFLFQIYTGLRISDTQRLNPLHVNKKTNFITKFRAKKTGSDLTIPLTKKTLAIIEKYKHLHLEGQLLPIINNQVANRYLKIMAEDLGLTHLVIYNREKGITREQFTERRCDIISTHDGRRTFITYCLSKGMGAQMIMSITGHKNYKSFERYVKFSDNDIKKTTRFDMELNKESEKIIISPKEIESYFDDEDNPTTSEKIPTCGSAKDLASSIFNLDVRAALNKTIEEYPYEKYTKVFYDLMKKHIVKISYPCDSMEIQPYEGYIKFYEDENNEFDYYKPYLIIAEKGVINTFDKYKTIYAITGGGKEPYGSIFITKRFYEKSSRIKDACNESEFETDFWLFFILSYRAYTVFFRRDFLTYQIKKLFNNNVNEFRNTLLYYLEIFLRKNFIGKGHEFALLQGLDYLELNIKVKKLEEVIDPTSNDTNRKKSEENPTETNIGLLTRFILGEKIPSSKKGDFTKKILIEFKFKLPSCGEPSRTLLHKLIFGLQKTLDKQLDNLKNLIDDLKTEKYKAWIKRILIDKHDELDLKKVEEKIQEQITRLEPTK